ncbi:MAG: nucleotidyltransferase family protein [Phycisphaerae bacterium]|nr:nucleotidyltransferase family protein [Phycisphaerae bacterium]MBN8596653.1 nucleotidyltransferase family protein [Planctomycetota bacterium]
MTLLERMMLGVERVRDRLLRASAALEAANISYAVAGGNAVAAWVATVDAAAVRNTQDVDILLRRSDLERAAAALESAGFVRRHVAGMDAFLDGSEAKLRDAVHVVFAGEKVRPEYESAAPEITESVRPGDGQFAVVSLESLVRMKLTSFRRKDQVHLQDMLEVGLIDATWTQKLSPPLAARLQELIDSPES